MRKCQQMVLKNMQQCSCTDEMASILQFYAQSSVSRTIPWCYFDFGLIQKQTICSICCLKGLLQSPNSPCSGITKELRISIGVILVVVFFKIIKLKTLWGWILLSSLCREGHWGSQSLNEPSSSSSCLYVREALLASYSFTIMLNIIPSRCKYSEGHNLAKSRRFPVFLHDALHTHKHLNMWLHRLLSFETNKSQPLRKCTNIHQKQSCSRSVKLTMSYSTQWKKPHPAELMNHII